MLPKMGSGDVDVGSFGRRNPCQELGHVPVNFQFCIQEANELLCEA